MVLNPNSTLNIVVSAIKVDIFKREGIRDLPQYKYKDLQFDVEEGSPLQRYVNSPNTRTDIKSSLDRGAIQNSITNLFNTSPGEKLLNPLFGLNLKQFLFEPVTRDRAHFIGRVIYDGITRYEPRIRVNNISVIPQPEEHQYVITLIYRYISIQDNSPIQFSGNLTERGFIFN